MSIPPQPCDECAAAYFRDVSRLPPLKLSEESELFERAARGDSEARRRVIEGNLRLVAKRAVRLARRANCQALGDLIQEGNLALMRAAENFDPSQGCRFSTYATPWIDRAMLKALRGSARLLSAPTRAIRAANALRRDIARERAASGRDPSPKELGERRGLPEEEARALLALHEPALSLDFQADPAGAALHEQAPCPNAPDPRASLFAQERGQAARDALAALTPREREVIQRRFGLDGSGEAKSLRATGAETGLSQEGARQVEKRALAKLGRSPFLLRLAAAEG